MNEGRKKMIKVTVRDEKQLSGGIPLEQEIEFFCNNRMELDALVNILLNHMKEFEVTYEEDEDVQV